MNDQLLGGWGLYQFLPAFVLGFHGCDRAVGEAILSGKAEHLTQSRNDYDWLGWGIYFWESNPRRALEFAIESAGGGKGSKGKIKDPFVLGAVINMGRCLNLSDSSALDEVKSVYETLRDSLEAMGKPLPSNGQSMKARYLDCAVFEFLHQQYAESQSEPYDTVRANYGEGAPLYPGTDLSHQDHTQICVRNTASILGYFRPIRN